MALPRALPGTTAKPTASPCAGVLDVRLRRRHRAPGRRSDRDDAAISGLYARIIPADVTTAPARPRRDPSAASARPGTARTAPPRRGSAQPGATPRGRLPYSPADPTALTALTPSACAEATKLYEVPSEIGKVATWTFSPSRIAAWIEGAAMSGPDGLATSQNCR